MVVRQSANVEQVVCDGEGAHLAKQARQHVKGNIRGNAGWDQIENPRTCHHKSGEDPITAWSLRLFFEVDDDSPVVCDGYTAARGIGHLIKTESSYDSVSGMKFAHAPQIRVGENVGIKYPERGIGTDPGSICRKRPR